MSVYQNFQKKNSNYVVQNRKHWFSFEKTYKSYD